MDIEIARANMVEQQIRAWNVLEMQTLAALRALRREDFVPPQYQHLAFADMQIPLVPHAENTVTEPDAVLTDTVTDTATDAAVMLEPKVGARMVEALGLQAESRVLEIGTGSGYLTALLARLSGHVTSLEIDPQRHTQAKSNLAQANIDNVTLLAVDGFAYCQGASAQMDGVADESDELAARATAEGTVRWDAILVTASILEMSPIFLQRLADGGKLVGIEGVDPAMQAVVYEKDGNRRTLFETSVPRLLNVVEPPVFHF